MTTELPLWLTNAITICLGLIVGSFLNVVVVRVPQRKSVAWPGSQCPKCKKPLAWYDNIPVLSYLVLRGKCRHCKAPISVRYPVIELLCAVLFMAAKVRFGWSYLLFIRDWPFLAVLLAITFIDLEHRIIPDVLSIGGLVLGLATAFFAPELGIIHALIGAGVGFGLFYLLAWGYYKYSGRAGLGGGDVKLLAMLGAYVGPSGVFVTILISSILGSVVGIAWAGLSGRQNLLKVSIPYGPFLVIGALYYYLLEGTVWLQFMTPM